MDQNKSQKLSLSAYWVGKSKSMKQNLEESQQLLWVISLIVYKLSYHVHIYRTILFVQPLLPSPLLSSPPLSPSPLLFYPLLCSSFFLCPSHLFSPLFFSPLLSSLMLIFSPFPFPSTIFAFTPFYILLSPSLVSSFPPCPLAKSSHPYHLETLKCFPLPQGPQWRLSGWSIWQLGVR